MHLNAIVQKPTATKFRPLTKEGLFHLHHALSSIDWGFISCSELDIDAKFTRFVITLQTSIFKIFPEKTNFCSKTSQFKKIN